MKYQTATQAMMEVYKAEGIQRYERMKTYLRLVRDEVDDILKSLELLEKERDVLRKNITKIGDVLKIKVRNEPKRNKRPPA